MDDNGNWTGGYYCIDQDEIDSVKIGISEISSDASLISYWKSSWLPECSGLWSAPQFSKADGSEFFTQKFKEQNKFVTKWKNENQEVSWRVRDIFWFENGDFVVNNGVMSTIGGESAYYYDKDQNKRWTIYDSSEQESGEYFSQMFVSDVKKVSDDKFLVAYQLYFNRWDRDYFSDGKFVGSKYYVKELAFGENLVPEKWFLSNPFSVSDMDVSIFDVKIVSENLVIYKKRTHDRSFALYLYDLVKNKEVRIDDFDGELDKY